MFNYAPSEADNSNVYAAYTKTIEKLSEAAKQFKELESLLEDNFMAITKTDRREIEDHVTTICSASWGLKVQAFKVNQARAKNRIMTGSEDRSVD